MNWNHLIIFASITVLTGIGFGLIPAFGDCVDFFGENPNDCVSYAEHPILTYSDFTKIPPTDPRADDTNANVRSDALSSVKTDLGGLDPDACKYTITGLYFETVFDRKLSFIVEGRENPETLNHEQGHWDLSEIYVRGTIENMQEEIGVLRTCQENDIKSDTSAIFDSHRYQNLQIRYDEEAGNVSKKANQDQWDKKIDCLLETPVPFSYCENLYPTPVKESTTPTPTPAPQLECGPGTAPKDGLCVRIEMDNGGGCLIATATYGSELAPQVQQLRELRDNSLLQTESGTSFMKHFNDFYYSFSPYIADYERENPLFKETVKIAITPMITSLTLMEYADSEESVLGIGISLIVLNGMMYVGIPILAIMRIRK